MLLRAELSVQLGLTDRHLQMWFCHRRLKDRKTPPVKRSKKEISTTAGGSGGVGDDVVASGEGLGGNEHGGSGGSGSGSSPFGFLRLWWLMGRGYCKHGYKLLVIEGCIRF
ncbi:putative transcription factor homeobox-WOX family [Helianthus anomalus]